MMDVKVRSGVVSVLAGLTLVLGVLILLLLLAANPLVSAQGPPVLITGTVFDAGGAPLSDANVWAEPYNGGPGGGDALSDAAGRYTITLDFTGTYRVGAYKFGNATHYYSDTVNYEAAMPVPASIITPATGIDFHLGPGGDVTGTVALIDNLVPLTRAFVNAGFNMPNPPWGIGGQVHSSGVYTLYGLPPGEYKLNAMAPFYLDQFFDHKPDWDAADPVQIVAGAVNGPFDFDLQPGGTITGTVMNEDGSAPIADAWVQAHLVGPPFGRGAPTDQNGNFTITGLRNGEYVVVADAPGYLPEIYLNQTDWSEADLVPVAVDAPAGNITFTLAVEEGGVVFGRVVRPNGVGVPEAWVEARTIDGLNKRDTSTDEFGFFRLGGLVTGTWELVAHPPDDPDFRYLDVSLPRLLPISYTSIITMQAPMTLTRINAVGRIMFPDGEPAGDSWASLHTEDFAFQKGMQAGGHGYFGTNVPNPGVYRLDIEPPWYAPGLLPIIGVPITVTDPSTITFMGTFTFAEAPKRITGRVIRDDTGSAVIGVPEVDVHASRRGGEGWAHTRTDANGFFDMAVRPGDWEVSISPSPDSPQDWLYPGQPKLVSFEPDMTPETAELTFVVAPAEAKVIGRVVEPDGTTPVLPWRGWVDVRRPDGVGNGVPIMAEGRFTVPVTIGNYNVWLGVDEDTYPGFASPPLPPVMITDPHQILDLGTISLVQKTAHIDGRVTISDTNGPGVGGVWVYAWQDEGNWEAIQTEPDGSFLMWVISGTWHVNVALPPDAMLVHLGPPAEVELAENETKFVGFVLVEATGTIEGRLENPDGDLLTEVDGWAYARLGNSPEPVVDGPIENGEFSFNVPPGDYHVGIWLPPNAGYTIPGEVDIGVARGQVAKLTAQAATPAEVAALDRATTEQRATVAADTVYPVTFVLLPNDKFIRGTFYLDLDKTQPAIGLEGVVFASGGFGGAWQAVPIDPDTASYEIPVAAGVWNVGYWIESPGYIHNPPPLTRVDTTSGNFDNLNFSVVASDLTIHGRILKPDGTPFPYAWAWAHRDRIPGVSAAIDTGDESQPPDGAFSISAVQGGRYIVGAHAPQRLGYIQPDAVIVPASATTGTGSLNLPIDLQFKDSNGTITGTVFYHDDTGQRVIGPGAWVWAWSEDGQHTGSPVNAEGHFRLNIITGTVWWVGAVYEVEEGSIFYETRWPPTRVPMTGTATTATVDLDLYRAGSALPPAIADTFAANVGWTGLLEDGTVVNIPPGAMPTTNPTDTVRISVTPLVENLPNTLSSRPFGFGYAIAAYEEATGRQLTENFNSNVLLIFYYTQQQLQQAGASEDDLVPAYFSTSTNAWTNVESFVVYTETQYISVYINHFSTWAMTAPPDLQAGGQNAVYLPLILK